MPFIAGLLFLAGCAANGGGGMTLGSGGGANVVASEATVAKVARVGFLTDYDKLRPLPGGGGILCWRTGNVDWKKYDAVLIERIQLYLSRAGAPRSIDPSDLKTLLDYFHNAVVKDLTPTTRVVNTTGPGVLRVRFALTDLTPTDAAASLAGTAIPYGFVAEIGSGTATGRPAGSTPYLGQTGMEVQFRDGATGAVVGECADTEIGRKYAAALNQGATKAADAWVNGYLDSFTSWSYAQDAFNKWAAEFAKRFNQLRGLSG
ncbi:MAG: DUF3313 domain-containing protein [Burkholderiales bacterium]|nr:DUF3313 domain-containing protein [Burkholderiales bacterium]